MSTFDFFFVFLPNIMIHISDESLQMSTIKNLSHVFKSLIDFEIFTHLWNVAKVLYLSFFI